jgi:NAD(P)-dependent dehydrogenase (short-subunit alcohol dehydrogenase family)
MRTFIQAEDIAETILFLCGPGGSKISGQAMAVDGHTEALD